MKIYENARGDLKWFKEDLFFQPFPLGKEELSAIYDEFLKYKRNGGHIVDISDWKLVNGYPVEYSNYATGSHAKYVKVKDWRYKGEKYIDIYKKYFTSLHRNKNYSQYITFNNKIFEI